MPVSVLALVFLCVAGARERHGRVWPVGVHAGPPVLPASHAGKYSLDR